jgi:hypothetical protein
MIVNELLDPIHGNLFYNSSVPLEKVAKSAPKFVRAVLYEVDRLYSEFRSFSSLSSFSFSIVILLLMKLKIKKMLRTVGKLEDTGKGNMLENIYQPWRRIMNQ